MSIAEDLAHHFVGREYEGRTPRFVSVKTIDYEDTSFGDINQFNMNVEYLSEEGNWKQSIIVRQFNSVTQFDNEIRQQVQMTRELQFHRHINILPIIHSNHQENYVVYEGSKGKKLSELDLDQDLHEFIMGMLCAIIQGNDVQENDLTNIRGMIDYLISISEFTEQQKVDIKDLLEIHYTILSQSKSGYHTLAVLDQNNIWFHPKIDRDDLTKGNIISNKAFQIDVLYVPPQSIINDRMMDIAMSYGQDAYNEYLQTKSVEMTRNRIVAFLEGYELQYEKNSYYPLEEIYEFGLTLDLQIVILTWLYANHLISQEEDPDKEHQIREQSYSFIEYLLSKRPFRFYEIDPSWFDELKRREELS